jgi:5-methylcytosine-specific restriction endonuclease McrA
MTSTLSNRELIQRIDSLTTKERRITLEILDHLIEMERRTLHVELGYRSMFDYCTRRLRYSASAANRRIRTARCMRDFRSVRRSLKSGALNLTTVSMIASVVTRENEDEIVAAVSGKTEREVDAVLAHYRPARPIRESIRAVGVPVGREDNGHNPLPILSVCDDHSVLSLCGQHSVSHVRSSATGATKRSIDRGRSSAGGGADTSKDNSSGKWQVSDRRTGGKKSTASVNRSAAAGATQNTTAAGVRFKLTLGLSEDMMKKIERVKVLLSGKYGGGLTLETMLSELLDSYIDKHAPEAKAKRRHRRIQTQKAATSPDAVGKRAIPAAMRHAVFARDGGQCAYVGPDGIRCGSRWDVEMDHIMPFGKGGDHSVSNLRPLCRAHNALESRKTYGARRRE